MKKNKARFWNGFWDKQECLFRVIEAVVADTPENIQKMYEESNPVKRRFPWYEAFIGQKIQMIEIHANDIVWTINNSDGKGLNKITNLVGKNEYGHKGVYAAEIIRDVPMSEWVKYSQDKEKELNEKVEAYFMEKEPFLYPKHVQEMAELRAMVENGGPVVKKKKEGDSTVVSIDRKNIN